ncbi:putative O-methyltransferase COMT-type, S-adenosyl-L-methionine-dependent methyltransferase [Rosa chinensis]|uniref:Putative O-methyltransferase COMT-type, S-adenosyl-L-methionine-dependent methyltransferase n=1 Tax=Rosa chinensis TaxID=74649 RepID=A0A2P6S305_ROSCH|nr:putative O-methyltransferase COMT-type, S-adenosyl-L-methionine-dependent methyltransferase [Rosa chinensis]
MACAAKITIKAILVGYKGGFDNVATLVDVGGGTGGAVAEIVKLYPSIKGINFDLPHVVATAPVYHGVSHVGSSDCVKILKNCRKAILESSGKVIILDVVLEPNGDGMFDDTGLTKDNGDGPIFSI